ncbi:MAG TPA: HAMP domain-containing sensor histidine kinase [Vicinamibacterales bacterium]|nr:HAMP domain-containing sensor histidine kinase [Vicinamibacterales bacterium]
MPSASLDTYATIVARTLVSERAVVAEQWLTRLHAILDVAAVEVFPSADLLDHIPALIDDIAAYLKAPEHEEIAANAAVIDKARELGMLRYDQKASVHQLLREYEILGEILESFLAATTERLNLTPSPVECLEVVGRLTRAVRTLMRTTVETFIAQYTAVIDERNERIDKFNRMASHELRTPIGTLVFAATLLSNREITADTRRLDQLASVVRNNVDRLSWLVQNLQRMARVDEAFDTPNHQRVDLGVLANEVRRQLDEMAQSRAVEVRVDPQLPAIVADPARVELVLLNLVSNGIKYRDPEKSHALVEIVCVKSPTGDSPTCVFDVRDNGIGIPPEAQEAIFQRFFRAHEHLDTALGVSGTGLGLSIAVECVKALGGAITCESTPGRGTAFQVTLPDTPAGDVVAPRR